MWSPAALLTAVWATGCAGSDALTDATAASEPLTVAFAADLPNRLARTVSIEVDPAQPVSLICSAGDDPSDMLQVASSAMASDHDLRLDGLRSGAWNCTAHGEDSGYEVSAPLVLTPAPDAVVLDLQGDASAGLWTAAALRMPVDNSVVVFDPEGRPRMWVAMDDPGVFVSPGLFAEPVDDLLLVGGGRSVPMTMLDGAGVGTWTAPDPVTGHGVHHDAQVAGDQLVSLTLSDTTHPNGDPLAGFGIEIVDILERSLAWSWVGLDHLTPLPGEDPFHANAARALTDALGEAVWVSLRNTDHVVRIDRATQQVTHILGAGGDFELRDASGLPSDDWFLGQHDIQFYDDHIVMHDNGGVVKRRSSRLLELELDLVNRVATIRRTFTEPGWWEPIMGGVELLDDGDWLLTRANCGTCDNGSPEASSHIVRVDPDTGTTPWRLTGDREFYRARSIDPCALLPATCISTSRGNAEGR